MYLHLGKDTVIKDEDIIGIFDLDTATVSRHTRKYLNLAEKKGETVTVSYELPKSFVVCAKPKSKEKKIYISQISSVTLLKRSSNFIIENK
ncbi:MAG: DUF370 domain-containing protein [Clostridia bacterium]|jgi:hypothetical protein|nr:DUF370 domain-containing protein [Clostridia bacterium]